MRVVVDTNVLISAGLKQGSFPNLALYQASQRCVLLKSVATDAQFSEVITRSYIAPLMRPELRDWLIQLMRSAELVSITERVVACRDPSDDKFLELAVNGRADLILTGDKDLLVLDLFRGVPIVTPRDFIHAHGWST